MTSIRIQNLSKRFGTTQALRHLDLSIEPGELFFLLGPSGCGKTTLLRSLAGFCLPDEGKIFFGDDEVTQVPPHQRNTGMMFQSYALWPHLTLAENVGFGLVERKVPKAEIRRRVGEALESVHLGAEADRKPNELSGGQQQRVALARALVIRPRCLLLDEPLSNLDAKLRLGMRAEIRRVCKEFKLTAVYVTHDQKEALSIADRMAVLDQGEVLQVGTPREVYRRPVCRTVAHFIGETDFIDGQVLGLDGAHLVIETPLGRFRGVGVDPASVPSAGTTVTLSIRPECWKLGREACSTNTVRGRIGNAIYLGEVAQYEFITGSTALKVYELNPQFIGGGTAVDLYASVDPNDVVVLQR